MKWIVKNTPPQDVKNLQEKYNLGLIFAELLAGRGVKKAEDIKFYLENDISFLENPFLFDEMETFCDRITQAAEEEEKVHIFGDRDVDGMTSTALLATELRNMGLSVSYSVPMGDEPYAFTKEAIDRIHADGVTLAITVDCGVSCNTEVEYAESLGIDFLITDHHIAPPELPLAVAIINPKVESSSYPYSGLAGVGVVAKCIWALRFSLTDYYKESFILLHAMPTEADTVLIEAAKVENLIVKERIAEEIVPGVLRTNSSRLISFLNCSLPVFVLDKDSELEQLKKAFPKADIYLQEFRDKFEKALPAIKDKSLFALSQVSKFARYNSPRSELDTLIGLFSAYVRITNPPLYKDYLKIMDLVAIGTISDLMPMTGENRILVRNGLQELEKAERVSLTGLLLQQNLLGRKISATDVSWQISPFLNAAGRMGMPDIAINMLLSKDKNKAGEYASELIRLNRERQKAGENCWTRLYPVAKQSYEVFAGKFVLVNDDNIPRGITGIFATRLQKTFGVPTMVITKTSDGRSVGSLRSPKNFNCHDFLQGYSDLLDDFGGHNFAGGFTMNPQKTDELAKRIANDIDFFDIAPQEDETLEIDVVIPKELFTEKIIKIVDLMEPYGEQNPILVFVIEGAVIKDLTAMTNQKEASSNHLRMNLQYGQYKWPAVFWSAGQRAGRDFSEGDTVNVAFRLGHNYFRNQDLLQITVLDIKRC